MFWIRDGISLGLWRVLCGTKVSISSDRRLTWMLGIQIVG